jgi:hypothetical protein
MVASIYTAEENTKPLHQGWCNDYTNGMAYKTTAQPDFANKYKIQSVPGLGFGF